jgi:hypothetical protein
MTLAVGPVADRVNRMAVPGCETVESIAGGYYPQSDQTEMG